MMQGFEMIPLSVILWNGETAPKSLPSRFYFTQKEIL